MTSGHFARIGLGTKERKEREKEQRRELIIDAGEKFFLKKGLHGTTMQEIAKACELSKGTLYLYFDSKEQLYLTIIHRAMTIMRAMMSANINAIEDPVLRLNKVGEAYYQFYVSYPEHFKLLSVIPEPDSEMFKDVTLQEIGMKLHEEEQGVWRLLSDIIVDGMERGIFRNDIDPLEVSMSLWGIKTFIINLMDHMEKLPKDIHEGLDHHMGKVDFMKSLEINKQRIIFSILKNPPADFDFYPVTG